MAVNFFPESSGSSGGGVTGDYIPLTQKGQAGGVATLDGTSKIPQAQLPDISITDTHVVASQVEMLALNAQPGDVAIRTDISSTYILKTSPATTLSNWELLPAPSDGVSSVDGRIGTVILSDLYQSKSNELTGLSGLSDVSGFIKKIGDGLYSIDPNSYLTTTSASTSYQPINTNLTSISGLNTNGILTRNAGNWVMDTNSYQPLDQDLTAIAVLSTTGYLEKTGANTWRTVAGPFQPLDQDLTDISALSGANGIIRKTSGTWGLDVNNYQLASNELSGISALADTSGLIRKTGDGTYSLDSNTYLTTASAGTTYQPLNTLLTGISGVTGTDGVLRQTAGVWALDASTSSPGGQTITLSGDVSGSGTSGIVVTLPNIVTAGSNSKITYNAKGQVTGGTALIAADIPALPWSKITSGTPVSLAGYGIADAYTKIETTNLLASTSYDKQAVDTLLATKQGVNNELSGFSALPDTAGLVKKTGDGTYSLDSNSYLTTGSANATYQPLNTLLTGISGVTGTSGILRQTSGVWGLDATAYLTGNQVITLSGDISGSGTTAITASLPIVGTAGTYTKVTTDVKGRVSFGSVLVPADIPSLDWSKITTGKPTTLAGYGITNGQPLNNELTALSSLADTNGLIRKTGDGAYNLDNNTYLTNNQTITLSGDATGTGTTSIAVTLPNIVTAGSSAKPTYNAKGLVTGGGSLLASDIPNLDSSKITTGTLADARLSGNYTGLGNLTGTGTLTFPSFKATNPASWDSGAGTVIGVAEGGLRLNGIPDIDGGGRKISVSGQFMGGIGISGSNVSNRGLSWYTMDSNQLFSIRWFLFPGTSSGETGADVGSDMTLRSYSDNGVDFLNRVRVTRSTGNVNIYSTTASTSTTTGALQVAGGASVQGSVFANLFNGIMQLRTFTNATRPAPSAGTIGQCYLNTDTGNIEYIATATTRKVITAV